MLSLCHSVCALVIKRSFALREDKEEVTCLFRKPTAQSHADMKTFGFLLFSGLPVHSVLHV